MAVAEAAAELELDSTLEPAPLRVDSTYPWRLEKKKKKQTGKKQTTVEDSSEEMLWRNVLTKETRPADFAPKRVWETKLDLLERLVPVGRVARAAERGNCNAVAGSGAELAVRKTNRLDARVQGWEWEEDEAEARRRTYNRVQRQAAI